MGMKKKLITYKKDSLIKPAAANLNKKEVIFVKSKLSDKKGIATTDSERTVDVIDLGAPRSLRQATHAPPTGRGRVSHTPRVYTPNPRLYPGPAVKPKHKKKRSSRSRRVFRRPVPNARLYRPVPHRPPPPPPPPRRPPLPLAPAPPLPAAATASRAALRLAWRRFPRATTPPHPPPSPSLEHSPPRRLVVTLPPATTDMDPHARHSTSPEDCSDGNDGVSAPSEFLAEFLSAIMRRQYLEALKYCRLILQYEPHNATARGFYPLLQHKVQQHNHNEGCGETGACTGTGGSPQDSLSDSSGALPSRSSSRSHSHSHSRRRHRSCSHTDTPQSRPGGAGWSGGWASSEGDGSGASQSSLELDTSSGERPASSNHDNNGNQPATTIHVTTDDLENDNDVSTSATFHETSSSGAAALRRLRAHFACSIK